MAEFENDNDTPRIDIPVTQPITSEPTPLAAPSAASVAAGVAASAARRVLGLSTRAKVILAAVGLFLVCCTCATIVGAAQNLANGGSIVAAVPTDTTAPADTPTSAPQPTATVDQKALLAAYNVVVQSDRGAISDALTGIQNDCVGTADFTLCRADLVNLRDGANQMLSDLSTTTVPPCIAAADKDLRMGLRDMRDAANSAISGIDTTDASQVDAAAAQLTKASREMNAANTALLNASC